MPYRQDQIFSDFEGDRWLERNKPALERFDPETDFPLKLMNLYDLRPRSILEVGAANGFRLAALSKAHSTRLVALEPSGEAIVDGRTKFPSIEFVKGVAHAIPLEELFDLIIVNFVFHWIDRIHLLKSVSEIDRLLGNNGFLIIGDFFPVNFLKVQYHHLPRQNVYTYKQNYAAIFLASGLYHVVGALTGNHASNDFSSEVPEGERKVVCLLQKQTDDHYIEVTRPGI